MMITNEQINTLLRNNFIKHIFYNTPWAMQIKWWLFFTNIMKSFYNHYILFTEMKDGLLFCLILIQFNHIII